MAAGSAHAPALSRHSPPRRKPQAELLEFLRRANCETRVEDDGSVIVEVPDALGEEQARLEVDLYLKAWQASRPDVEAHLI